MYMSSGMLAGCKAGRLLALDKIAPKTSFNLRVIIGVSPFTISLVYEDMNHLAPEAGLFLAPEFAIHFAYPLSTFQPVL
jgi:hypothetical protein